MGERSGSEPWSCRHHHLRVTDKSAPNCQLALDDCAADKGKGAAKVEEPTNLRQGVAFAAAHLGEFGGRQISSKSPWRPLPWAKRNAPLTPSRSTTADEHAHSARRASCSERPSWRLTERRSARRHSCGNRARASASASAA